MAASQKNKGLGRGLDAIYGTDDPFFSDEPDTPAQGRLIEMTISRLIPGSTQPRTRFNEDALAELADSIRQQGIISPIVVRPTDDGLYEIIAGERRFQAARRLGMETVPVIVRDVDTRQALAMALIENIQRENLNPIEEAQGIQRLIDECDYTHEQVAEAIGRSRSGTTNMLRLLTLTDEVKHMVADGELEMGHARALVALEGADQILAAKEVAAKGLSVRQAEALVRRAQEQRPPKPRVVIKTRDDLRLEESLAETLGAVVRLTANPKGKGKIVIEFSDLEQLQGIVDRIQRQ